MTHQLLHGLDLRAAHHLNVHFHLVVPDGVFVDDAQGLRFELLPVPTNADVLAILDRLAGS